MKKNGTVNPSRFIAKWPQLDEHDQNGPHIPYEVYSPRQLENELALGERPLVGLPFLLARLDIALSGLWQELGGDFFDDNFFPHRLEAARCVLLTAQVFLAAEPPSDRTERVRLLQEEAETALQQWNVYLLKQQQNEPLLYAAEEAEESL